MVYANPYTQIIGNMDSSGMIDRTAWLFRKHFKDYLIVSMVTFALPFVIFVSLLIATQTDYFVTRSYDKITSLFVVGSVIVFPTCMTIFSVWSEMAISYYTHKRIHLEEVDWWQACIATTSYIIPNLLVKTVQIGITIVVGIVAVFAVFVPIIGSLLYFWIVIGAYTYLTALFPIITIAEPHTPFIRRLARNRSLVGAKIIPCFTTATVGTFILAGLLFLMYISLGLSLYWVVIPYFKQLNDGELSIRTLNQILSIIFTILTAGVFMLAVPTKPIFYTMMYYSLVSYKEAYHLEYQIKMYQKMMQAYDEYENKKAV
ncbi:MAG: hypothetical protein NZ519_04110 [Bacteroidia bacterium]|nr:hypothetical protein [Bacteroidia bacterium]MDW8301200.1 hypothetical protein [Bacteroidia bacterium]